MLSTFILDTFSNSILLINLFITCLLSTLVYLLKVQKCFRINLVTSICAFVNIVAIDYAYLSNIVIKLRYVNSSHYFISFTVNEIGLIALNVIGVLWPISLIYVYGYLRYNQISSVNQFLFFFNFSILIGILTVLSDNLFSMFVFYEILTFVTIPLIVHEGHINSYSGLRVYLLILLGSSIVLLLPSIIWIYVQFGYGNFIANGFMSASAGVSSARIVFCALLFGIAKAALVPLHQWLPAAMVASYPVSALLHSVLVVNVGLVFVLNVTFNVFGIGYLDKIFGNFFGNWNIALIASCCTVLFASIKALRTDTIKMILAYSTISQLSLALVAAFAFIPNSLNLALFHMVSHSFAKICTFFSMGIMYSVYRTYTLSDLKGIAYFMPVSALICTISCLSLIGFPPLIGFSSKFNIIKSVVSADINWVVLMIVGFSGFLTSLPFIKIIIALYTKDVYIKKDSYISDKLHDVTAIRHLCCATILCMIALVSLSACLPLLLQLFWQYD